jgi:DNA (cytosine-5)-methyltransferase 1
LRELSLFTGAGGGLLGSAFLGWETVCAVEIEEYPRRVLLARQKDGILPRFPIWDDAQTFNGKEWQGRVDIITGGFPCQPFSIAGRRKAQDDSRNMWPATIRIIREVKPKYCFLENVFGLILLPYFGEILRDLAESGYNAKWKVLSAAEIGAAHKRDRLWIMAYSQDDVINRELYAENNKSYFYKPKLPKEWNDARDLFGADYRDYLLPRTAKRTGQSGFRLVVDGVDNGMDRLKAIGNGQVPQVFKKAWEILSKGVI